MFHYFSHILTFSTISVTSSHFRLFQSHPHIFHYFSHILSFSTHSINLIFSLFQSLPLIFYYFSHILSFSTISVTSSHFFPFSVTSSHFSLSQSHPLISHYVTLSQFKLFFVIIDIQVVILHLFYFRTCCVCLFCVNWNHSFSGYKCCI